MTTIDQIHPARREHRGPFPRHTPVEDLPERLRRVLSAAEARAQARERFETWLEVHGHRDPEDC